MDVAKIQRVGRGLEAFLAEFSDCFGRCDTQSYLEVYVEGQNSDLQRKSAEPIALRAGIVPRSLQVFLGSANWDERRMIDRVQEIVVRDHSHPRAIGLIDETGSAKKGTNTARSQTDSSASNVSGTATGARLTTAWSVFTSATRLEGFIRCWTAICFFQRVGPMTGNVGSERVFLMTSCIVPNPRLPWLRFDVLLATAFASLLGRLMSTMDRAMTFWTAWTHWARPTWRRCRATSMDGR